MSDSIKVAIKVRPLIKREKDENLPIQWAVQGNYIASTDSEIKKRGDGGFHFDHIFDERTNNKDVFEIIVRPIVDAAVNGFNGTVFAYGQTSSGKTYTMLGALNEPGIIPLAIEYMFDAIANTMRREFLLRVSYLEIYNERVNDLLNKSGTDLKLHEDLNGQIIIKCKEEVTNSPEHVLSIMKKGDKNRRIGETNMNERSSRSHTIFRITIESRDSDADSDGAIQVSQLNLVDLAGSERARQTGATGERFKEGRHINMSLSTLGLVIMQLSEAQDTQKYVNFRDSKLTRLLQTSLGGNAMTAIICAITPAALEESQCTLSFASRAKSVKNKPQINEVMSDATLLKRYAKQIAKLNAELEKMKQENRTAEEMQSKLHEKDQANQLLEERIELLKTKIVSGDNTSIEESFKCRSKRRRTWGGPATLKPNLSIFQPSDILPTIKEMSPEKPCRKSIIQSVDLMNQTFQTDFADFELELIKAERERENEDDSDEELFITKRKNQNHVKFMDDVCIYKPDYETYETTPEKTNVSCQTIANSQQSPGTPKHVLRERLDYLQQEFNDLCEYTTLEKQMYVENHQCVTTNEEQENIAELEQPIKNFIAAKTILAENSDVKEHLQRQSMLLSEGFNNNFDNEEFVTDLDIKTQELHEIKGDVISLKLDMTKLQRTIFLLTTENVELSAKLTAEKEEGLKTKAHYQKSMDELHEEICKLEDAKTNLMKENLMLNEQVKSFESQIINVKENQICLDCQDKKNKSTVKNNELFHTDTEEHIDFKNTDEISLLGNTQKLMTDKEADTKHDVLLLNFSTSEVEVKTSSDTEEQVDFKNLNEVSLLTNTPKLMTNNKASTANDNLLLNFATSEVEVETLGTGEQVDFKNLNEVSLLANTPKLMEDKKEVPENDNNLLLDFSTLKVEGKTSSEDSNDRNGKSIEDLTVENSLLKTELINLKEKITVLTEENKTFLNKSFKSLADNIQNNTCDNTSYIASIFNSTLDTEEKLEDEEPDILLHKCGVLKEKVDHLLELNKKLTELKTTSCVHCAQMKELNESNKVAKLEAKVLTHKLEDMQEKFKRKCADVEVLRNKANEELSLSICETSLDTSLLDVLNVTSVEEEVSHLNKEMQVLKDDHAKLSHLYEEKCSELEKLHNNTVNETDLVSPCKKDSKKSKFRIDKLEKDIDHVKVDLQELKSNVISDLKRSLNEKASLLSEINMLKSVNDELSKAISQNNLLLETSENNIQFLENKIRNLNTDVENYKMTQKQMQNENCNLETEMTNMKENINEKEVIIKDLQQIINEAKRKTDDFKEDTFCSENFIKESFNAGHIDKHKHNLENELTSEVEKLKNDLNTVRNCITKEIRSLETDLDDEYLLNKSVDDLFLTFLQTLISKEKEIIGAMQQQFSCDKEKLEDEKRQILDAEKRATLWAKELETEIAKLRNEVVQQETERSALLDKISHIENLLEESNRGKQILTEQIQSLNKDYNDFQKSFNEHSEIKVQQDRINIVKDKEIELQAIMKQEKNEYERKIHNLTTTLESYKLKNLELIKNVESLEICEKDLKNLLNIRTAELTECNENVHKLESELECLTNNYNKLNHEMENKNICITTLTAEIEDLSKSVESYKIKNMELVTKLEGLEIIEKNLNITLNTKISELTKSSQNIQQMKTEMEHLVNTCAKLNHDIEDKKTQLLEVTALLQNKSDMLSEHKLKLNMILPEVELLKKQLQDQKLSTNKYNTELQNLKVQNEMELANIKDTLSLECIKYAELNEQLADLKNKNISLLAELDTLKEQYSQLEEKNLKLEQKVRKSVSKIKADTQIEDLQEENKTLESNLEGAYNCIAELKSKKKSLLEELMNIKKQNESLLEENIKIKDVLNKTRQSNFQTLEEQYNALLNEKSKIALELEENNMLLYQKEEDLKHYINLCEELKQKNKELDEEAEGLIKENEQLTEKVYSYFDDDNTENNLRAEIKILKEENENLHTKLTKFDETNKLQKNLQVQTTDISVNLNDTNEIIQQKKQMPSNFESNKQIDVNDQYVNITKRIQDLELELVSKNGKIAVLELQIQSENFPYKKKCRDLEENILAFKNKNIQLEGEIKRLRHALTDVNTKEYYMSKKGHINTKDQCVQTIPNNRIQFCGTSSGVVDEHLKIQKLEKEKSLMKQICRSRAQQIKELEEKLAELETGKSLSDKSNVALKENIFYSTSRSLSK